LISLDLMIEKFKLLDNRLIRIMEAAHIETFTAQFANDIFEKAGSSTKVVECSLITEDIVNQLWNAAVKIGLVDE